MKKNQKILAAIIGATLALSLTLTGCGSVQTQSQTKPQTGANSSEKLDYPTKPINMDIAFTAGGSSDVQARIMQKYWNKYVPQEPWVFKYVTGAGGAVGFAEIAHAKPDGYTIGGINIPHIILQPLGQGAQFSIDDYAYIGQFVNDDQVLAVRKDSKFHSWKEIADYAKTNPNKLKVGIVGTYTGQHMMLLDFEDQTGIKLTQVVYQGAADQNAALLGGEIDFMIGNLNDVMRSLDQMNVLNVSADKRSSLLPDVPTFKEQGLNLVSTIRRGFAVPKNTDPKIVQYLRDTFKKINDDPDYQADMKKAGQPLEYMSGDDLDKFVHGQNAHAKELLQKFGLLK